MQIATSSNTERRFGIFPKAPSTGRRYTVTVDTPSGATQHDFVDLDSAIKKAREMVELGMPLTVIKPRSCDTAG